MKVDQRARVRSNPPRAEEPLCPKCWGGRWGTGRDCRDGRTVTGSPGVSSWVPRGNWLSEQVWLSFSLKAGLSDSPAYRCALACVAGNRVKRTTEAYTKQRSQGHVRIRKCRRREQCGVSAGREPASSPSFLATGLRGTRRARRKQLHRTRGRCSDT